MNLIYFDDKQLEDYYFDETYRKAYNMLLEESEIFIWSGRHDENLNLTCLNEHGDTVIIPIFEVQTVLIRGKDFPYPLFEGCRAQIINPKKLVTIFEDKVLTKEYINHNFKDITSKKIDDLSLLEKDKMYVFKPAKGLKGEGIVITDDHAKLKYLVKNSQEPCFIEEFVKGATFMGHKTYDIRVVFVNTKPVLTMVRVPGKGKLLANLAQGGTKEIINFSSLPDMALSYLKELSYKIQSDFGTCVYSIDFNLKEDGTINIFEFNTYPGIRPEYSAYLAELKEMMLNTNMLKSNIYYYNYDLKQAFED